MHLLDEVDHQAHTTGGFSDEYYKAVKRADEMIGKIYDALAASKMINKSLFIGVADHGETEKRQIHYIVIHYYIYCELGKVKIWIY